MNETIVNNEKSPSVEAKTADSLKKNKKPMSRKTVYTQKFTAPLRKKRKNEYDPKEEARLERLVFGDANDVISKLTDDDPWTVPEKDEKVNFNKNLAEDEDSSDSDIQEVSNAASTEKKAAWLDEDDAQYTVKAAFKAQQRESPEDIPQKFYTELLDNKYKQLVGTPKWAELKKPDPETDDIDNDILKHSCHLEQPKAKNLPKNIIEIKALNAINKQTHTEGPIVTSLEFHPSSTVALVAGTSGILSLFQVDGIQNTKLHSIQYKKFPITKATFLKDGTEVLLGSKYYTHCHSYNLLSGKTYRIPLPHGIINMKHYEVSPDGKLIALCGRSGEVHLLTCSSKELIGTFKMNGECRALAFTPDSKTLITHGGQATVPTAGATSAQMMRSNAFTLTGNTQATQIASMTGTACQTDWLTIPCATNLGRLPTMTMMCVDRLCGGTFSAESQNLNASSVVSTVKPFRLIFHTDGTEAPNDVGNRGFCLNYVQQPCTTKLK